MLKQLLLMTKIIMENSKTITVNEDEMLSRAQQVAKELSIKEKTNILFREAMVRRL